MFKKLFQSIKQWNEKQGVWSAAFRGDTASVTAILDKGGDVEEQPYSTTPLMIAAANKHVDTVRLLLERGANVNPSLRYNGDAFKEAVMAGNTEIVRMFLDRGADVNAKDDEHSISALMDAVDTDNIELIKLLLDNGADINVEDWEARTALTYARGKRPEIAELLKSRGGIETGEWADSESPD